MSVQVGLGEGMRSKQFCTDNHLTPGWSCAIDKAGERLQTPRESVRLSLTGKKKRVQETRHKAKVKD